MEKKRWNFLSFCLIAGFFFLFVLNWKKFPFFLDIYYHLNVMHGFNVAGGVVSRSFWELAPIGQPLLYPPLFHLLMLAASKIGLGTLFIARLFSVAPFIILVATANFVTGRLISKKAAFFVTAALCIPYSFFLKLTITGPVAICLIFALLAYYSIEKKRIIAAAIFLSLVFYSHLGLPWMVTLAFAIFGMLRKDIRKPVFAAILLSFALSAPVIYNIASNLGRLQGVFGINMPEGTMFEIYPLVYALAITGLFRLKDRNVRPTGLFFLCFLAGLAPMAINYRYRFLSGEGLLPVLFFAGLGLESIMDKADAFMREQKFGAVSRAALPAALLLIVNLLSPSFSSYVPLEPPYDKREFAFYLRDSTATNLIPAYKKHMRPFEINLYDAESERWIREIEKNTVPEDIICSNDAFIGSFISAFSGRANAARLFLEVAEPDQPISEFGSSKMVVWLKEPDGRFSGELNKCIEKFGFKVLSYTDFAAILIKQKAPKAVPVKPAVPSGIAFGLLAAFLAAAAIDLTRPGKRQL